MKKVSHRVASGISLFALPPLPFLFPIFCGSVNHSFLGCRDSQPLYFLILIATSFFFFLGLLTAAEMPLSFFVFCNQFVLLFHLVLFPFACNRDISCCSIVDKTKRKKIHNLRRFFSYDRQVPVITGFEVDLPLRGKEGSFPPFDNRSESLKAIDDALSC